jgi:hypothetical protein
MATNAGHEINLIDDAWQLLIPGEAERRSLCSGGHVLVHNTSPDNAKNILSKPELWLQNARAMKDEMEVRLGRECVDRFFIERSVELSAALNAIAPGLWEELSECWKSEREPQIGRTYIACFSAAHAGEYIGSERHWAEYGHVAFLFDPAFTRDEAASLSLYLVKVIYGKDRVDNGLLHLLKTLQHHRERLSLLSRETLLSFIRHQLFFTSVASKSEDFAWEKEWRLIHAPHLFASAHIEKQIVGVGEKQRPIYPLPLRNTEDGHNPMLNLPNLIRNIVIRSAGAAEDQGLRYNLISQLKYHGVSDAEGQVLLSQGPHVYGSG